MGLNVNIVILLVNDLCTEILFSIINIRVGANIEKMVKNRLN